MSRTDAAESQLNAGAAAVMPLSSVFAVPFVMFSHRFMLERSSLQSEMLSQTISAVE